MNRTIATKKTVACSSRVAAAVDSPGRQSGVHNPLDPSEPRRSGWRGCKEGGGDSGTNAPDRATVAIAPDEKTMQVSISDGLGRNVMNATMSGPAATTPYLLLDWG